MLSRASFLLLPFSLLSCSSPPEKPKSILLVTIDTLRADRLGSYGGKVATPNLDRLAQEGAVFLDAVAQSSLTLPSHSSILTGTYPTYHGVRDNGRFRLSDGVETLTEILKKAGYRTAAFVGGYPVHSRFGLGQGFEHYDDRFSRSPGTLAFTERRAEDVVGAAKDWIEKNNPELYFVWVHLFDPHAPYEPPEPFRNRGYDGEVAYVDHALGRLFPIVGQDPLTVVTADHGEGLGEHGETTHSLFIYDSTLKVPLIFRGSGVPQKRIRDQVRTIDILPTVLELTGRSHACSACQGKSLVPLLRGQTIEATASYAETLFPRLNLGWSELRSVRRTGWKYIAAPSPELYHLGMDPGELKNLAKERPEKLKELAAELSALERETAAGFASSSPAPDTASPEVLSLLRSLGYASASKTPLKKGSEGPLPDPKTRLAVWEKFRRGMELVSRGEYEKATIELTAVLKEDPQFLLAQSYLAGAYFERGQYPQAAEICARILRADPTDYEAALLLGRSLGRLGRAREAEEALQQAARLDPESAPPLAELANLHLQKGATEKAREALSLAERRDAHATPVLIVRGKLLAMEQKPKDAEQCLRSALEQSPWEEEPRVQLGNLLLQQRRLPEAESLFRAGLALRPESAPLTTGVGHALALAGNMDLAVRSFEQALKLAPDSPVVLNSLGFAYLEKGEPERGLRLLRRSLSLAPSQPELKNFLKKLKGEGEGKPLPPWI